MREKDSVHRYRIADDLLRLRSNYGLKAWNKMYYTIDAELRTQLLHSYLENKRSLQSDFLAPYTINGGARDEVRLLDEVQESLRSLLRPLDQRRSTSSYTLPRDEG